MSLSSAKTSCDAPMISDSGVKSVTPVTVTVLVAPASVPFLLKTPDNPVGLDGAIFEGLRSAFLEDFSAWAESGAEGYFVPGTSRSIVDWTLRMMTQTSLQATLELNRIQTSICRRSSFTATRMSRLRSI